MNKTRSKITNGVMKKSPPLMYIKTNEIAIPKKSPPSTAPSKLSRPPTTAAIKPETRSSENSIESGEIFPFPFTVWNSPATAPAAPGDTSTG
jgi:hypothetical protein